MNEKCFMAVVQVVVSGKTQSEAAQSLLECLDEEKSIIEWSYLPQGQSYLSPEEMVASLDDIALMDNDFIFNEPTMLLNENSPIRHLLSQRDNQFADFRKGVLPVKRGKPGRSRRGWIALTAKPS